MKAKLIAIAAVSAVMLSSCGTFDIPQTREEFVRHPKMKKESYTVPRNVDAVVASLDRAKRCVDDEHSQTRTGGGGMVSTSRDLYYMTVGKTSRGHAELSFRWAMSNGIMQPKGGYLMLIGDLDAQGPNATKVTLHHGGATDALINALKEWSKGKDQSCHGYNRR
jgi:hypothetical protein